ncbi:hypothetical protein POKO110462_15340 [Pontibacter korlensis]
MPKAQTFLENFVINTEPALKLKVGANSSVTEDYNPIPRTFYRKSHRKYCS